MSDNAIRSMTGYAGARRTTPRGELVLTLRSVNHRALDIHFHHAPELEALENSLRRALVRRVRRGHLDVRISLEPAGGPTAPVWNRALLDTWLASFREAAREHGLTAEPDLNAAFRIPGMLGERFRSEPNADIEADVQALAEEALDALDEFRRREGGAIAVTLVAHNDRIAAAVASMERLRERVVGLLQQRLAGRLQQLLQGNILDPQRLAQEAALLADRSDIGEEMTRLKVHSGQLGELLARGGEVGKKLDFLLQEMQREANTILSKTSGLGEEGLPITDLALGVKSEIEKIREQALNLE